MRKLLPFLVAALLPAAAPAQTPMYVRPSRGAAMTIFSGVTGTTVSAVYNWTGFTGSNALIAGTAGCTAQFSVEGAATATGTFVTAGDASGATTWTGAVSATVYTAIAFPFARFTATIAPGACPLGFTVSVIPEPYALRVAVGGASPSGTVFPTANVYFPVPIGGLRAGATTTAQIAYVTSDGRLLVEGGAVAPVAATADSIQAVTNAAGGTTVQAAAAAGTVVHSTIVQNVGTSALTCSAGGVPVIGTRGIVLSPGTAANDGLGASATWAEYTGAIACIAAGVGGSAAVQRW